ncbi:efflux RND transporter permease subunit [Ferrimonas pelagia]|uniref:Efflux RND transporter permease subunit VexD n=1 Tax=Ferrimonas pelagia TaxID=1177826 RepID=A0ABP9EVF7_9GAMM
MSSISTLAYRQRPVIFTVLAILMLAGLNNFFTLPAQEDPSITIKEALVTTAYPGLSAEKMELLITKPLELAIREIPEIYKIRSTSRPGVSIIKAKIHDHINDDARLEQIWDNMRQKLAQARHQLPEGTAPPIVNDDFGDVAVVTAALTGADFSAGEKRFYAEHIRDQLYRIPGTNKVELHGVQDERIFIEPDIRRISELGFTSSELIQILRSQNVLRPGGELIISEGSNLIELSGLFTELADIEQMRIPTQDGLGSLRLGDLAQLRRAAPEPSQPLAFFNGEPAVILSVSMQDHFRVLDYGPQVKALLAEIETSLPIGLSLNIVTYQADQVENAVYGVTISVLQTLLIVLAVVILFLGVRTGTIVGFIIPSVMLITLSLMGIFGVSLERMSLATMVISLGLLVDNGVVMAEDFKRRLEDGLSRDEALEVCGRELALPLLSSTLTTILVFIPLMLAAHDAGDYTRSISMVILLSLSTSWVLSMTVTPVLCYRFMHLPKGDGKPGKASYFESIERAYGHVLGWVMGHRRWFLAAVVVSFVLAVVAMQSVPQKFFPDSDRPQVLITLELPSGTTISQTSDQLNALFPILSDKQRFDYIDSYAAYAGYGGPRFVLVLAPTDPASNIAFLVANLDDISTMPRAVKELRQMFRSEFPQLNARVRGMFFGPSDPNVLHVQVKGPDEQVVYQYGQQLAAELKAIPGMIDVWQNWETPIGKLYIDVDQDKARRAGVSSQQVADALSTYYSGRVVSQLYEGSDIIPITVRGQRAQRESVEGLYSLNINVDGYQSVPLMQIAEVRLQSTQGAIQRQDLSRALTVEGRPLLNTPEDLVPQVGAILDEINRQLPPGHWAEFDGIITDSKEGQAALKKNFPLALGLIVVLLIAQFNGFKRPLIVLASIPLLVIGAAMGLRLLNGSFGFMVLLGLFALAGIIINNALVLVDRIDIERRDNDDLIGAIVHASKRRLRPIIMTTVTTVLGLSPLILSNDPMFHDMAVVIAFGLLVGTVFTLGVTPVLYSLLFKGSESEGAPRI